MSWKLPDWYIESYKTAPPSAQPPGQGLQLSARLAALAGHIHLGARVVDIGTDHAHLPIALIQTQRAKSVVAIDKKTEPLANAAANLAKCNIMDQIILRQGDGLSPLKPGEADTAIAAGLSGDRIAEILAIPQTKRLGLKRLITQPNTNLSLLRRALSNAEWQISAESMVACGRRFFVIIVFEAVDEATTLSLSDATLGPILRQNPQAPLYGIWLKQALYKAQTKANGYKDAGPLHQQTLARVRQELEILDQAHQEMSKPPKTPADK